MPDTLPACEVCAGTGWYMRELPGKSHPNRCPRGCVDPSSNEGPVLPHSEDRVRAEDRELARTEYFAHRASCQACTETDNCDVATQLWRAMHGLTDESSAPEADESPENASAESMPSREERVVACVGPDGASCYDVARRVGINAETTRTVLARLVGQGRLRREWAKLRGAGRQQWRYLPPLAPQRLVEGTWPADCVQRAFVDGAKWWEFHKTGATMWGSDRALGEAEAIRRYGAPQ